MSTKTYRIILIIVAVLASVMTISGVRYQKLQTNLKEEQTKGIIREEKIKELKTEIDIKTKRIIELKEKLDTKTINIKELEEETGKLWMEVKRLRKKLESSRAVESNQWEVVLIQTYKSTRKSTKHFKIGEMVL